MWLQANKHTHTCARQVEQTVAKLNHFCFSGSHDNFRSHCLATRRGLGNHCWSGNVGPASWPIRIHRELCHSDQIRGKSPKTGHVETTDSSDARQGILVSLPQLFIALDCSPHHPLPHTQHTPHRSLSRHFSTKVCQPYFTKLTPPYLFGTSLTQESCYWQLHAIGSSTGWTATLERGCGRTSCRGWNRSKAVVLFSMCWGPPVILHTPH